MAYHDITIVLKLLLYVFLPAAQAVFPGVNFNVLDVARGASDVIAASTCWVQYVPEVCATMM
jgi:hypothetical protein